MISDAHAAGRSAGLAAGLRVVVDTIDAVPTSGDGRTLLPTGYGKRLDAEVLPFPMASLEGLELVRVSPVAVTSDQAALLLAAVRIGVSRQLLDLTVAHLATRSSDGSPLTGKQLVQAAIADCVTSLELCWDGVLSGATGVHARLDQVGWTIASLCGAAGYLVDHPARCLYLAELLGACWVPAAPGSEWEL